MELEKRKAPMDNEIETAGSVIAAGAANNAIFQREAFASASQPHAPSKAYCAIKRCFDFLLSLLVSLVMLLPLVILMLLIMAKDPGNPLYFQRRVGKGGRPIYVAKLRTMKKNSDHLEETLTPEQLEEYRCEYKLRDDPRLIGWKKPGDGQRCFGAMLRKFSLDELPQFLFNVCLKGDMSIVGPRPVLQEELERYYTLEEQREILSVKPGLTGYWQAYARNGAAYGTRRRQEMELYYARHASIRFDFKIIISTFYALIRSDRAS